MAKNMDYWEMSYVSQLIYRINTQIVTDCRNIAEVLFSQLGSLIPFRRALMADVLSDSQPLHFVNIYSFPDRVPSFDENRYLNGPFRPVWQDYMDFPWSSVFIASSVQDRNTWINSPVYKAFYEPQDLYYALHGTFIYNDIKLGMLTLCRSREDGDFTEQELWYMELLKPHIEMCLYRTRTRYEGLQQQPDTHTPAYSITMHYIEKYNLTHREVAVVNPILNGSRDSDVCRFLGITQSTLDKHIHNIYKKTGANSRATLFQKFKN